MLRHKTKKENEELFLHTPIWKLVLKMAIPSMFMMLVFGGYAFSDNVLSINFAADAYNDNALVTSHILSPESAVRYFMSAFGPINALLVAVALLFGMGISTRISINLGAKKFERAKNTLKTGFMVALGTSIIMVPILIFASKSWMAVQYPSAIANEIANKGFEYAWIIILLYPIQMALQIFTGLLRVEGRNKQMLIATVTPIFLNLFLDWLFMGPGGMGVEGGAWATFIANTISFVIAATFIHKSNSKIINFKNMIGLKLKWLTLIGIVLVGIAPFLRNFAQSITQTAEMNVIKDVSNAIYGTSAQKAWMASTHAEQLEQLTHFISFVKVYDPTSFEHINQWAGANGDFGKIAEWALGNGATSSDLNEKTVALKLPQILIASTASSHMTQLLTGVFPIFMLFFPVMFAFAQAARPIASYNYGAKRTDRVRLTYFYTIIFSTIGGTSMYFLAAFALSNPLLNALGLTGSVVGEVKEVLKIMLIGMPLFGLSIGGMVMFGSTDRILLSIIASSLRGFILIWPFMYGFRELAISHTDQVYLLWWFYPSLVAATSLIILVMSLFTTKNINKKHITLDQRIEKIYLYFENLKSKSRKRKRA